MISDGAPYTVFAGAKQAAELITLTVLGVISGQSGNHIAPPAFRQGGGTVTMAPTRHDKISFNFVFFSPSRADFLKSIMCSTTVVIVKPFIQFAACYNLWGLLACFRSLTYLVRYLCIKFQHVKQSLRRVTLYTINKLKL